MGVKDRDEVDSTVTGGSSDVRPREKRTRSSRLKEDRDAHRHHHHKSSSTRRHKSSTLEGVGSHLSSSYVSSSHSHRHRTREEKERDRELKSSSMTELPEFSRTPMPGDNDSRVSLPYPTFSKAHSKESVLGNSREDVSGGTSSRRNNGTLSPEATDVGSTIKRSKSAADHSSGRKTPSSKDDRPPTPPETDLSAERRRSKTSMSRLREEYDRPDSRTSGGSRSSSKRDDKSTRLSTKSKASSHTTYMPSKLDPPPHTRELPPPPVAHSVADDGSYLSDDRTAGARSGATTVPPKRSASTKAPRVPSPIEVDDSPESVQDSSPKTPTAATPQFPPPSQAFPDEKPRQARHVDIEDHERPTPSATPMTDLSSPPPPPPPPPPALDIQEVPRVDYLLQHGGLPYPVPRNFLSVVPRQNGTRPSNPPLAGVETIFAPFFNILDQYQTVINRQGSVAVATGHKSIARRLLDRLEDVFSRELPAEGCTCVMCEKAPQEHRGLGWGEVLERVGGRVELPPWPPFDLASLGTNAVEQAADVPPRPASPVKLDPDIAEEFRDHYLRQSKKVRSAVDKWMNNCAEAPPPSEVDDETLAFAMLTSLEHEERPYFNALLSGAKEVQPTVRAPTPMRKTRSDFLVKTGLAIQRLYRLPHVPRDAEAAMHLVKNPMLHDLLSTVTDINTQEWEILVSGRFDGFLWSGADVDDALTATGENPLSRGATPASGVFSPPPSRGPSRGPMTSRQTPGYGTSRNTTPFSGAYSRGATPASFVSASSAAPNSRQPVSHDEEVEVAVLSEVEREIYQGMEALEDAFEKLHRRAEVVRNALRQRNAGLSLSMQSRRAGRIDVLPHSGGSQGYERPSWAMGEEEDAYSESDWGGDDFSIAPEDSASNVASNRHRRPKRRTERRTPAPIEEDAEEN